VEILEKPINLWTVDSWHWQWQKNIKQPVNEEAVLGATRHQYPLVQEMLANSKTSM